MTGIEKKGGQCNVRFFLNRIGDLERLTDIFGT